MGITQSDVDALLAAAGGLDDKTAPQADAAPAVPRVDVAPATAGPPAVSVSPSTSAAPQADLSRILRLSVPVIVKLAEQNMPVSKVLEFRLGAIIEFEKAFDAKLALVVANRCIGEGQAVKVGENFGLRVSRIGRIEDTIQALGGA